MTAETIASSFDLQAQWCEALDAPIYAYLIEAAATDIRSNGIVAEVIGDYDGDPVADALALRFMGGVHRLVLMGLAPTLAAHYPSVGGSPNPDSMTADFLACVEEHHGYLRDALSLAPQTNETGRCAALAPGLAAALGGRRLGVRLLEIGTAAGLNLFPERFHYTTETWSWGDPNSRVVIEPRWHGAPPSFPDRIDVVERRGCDVAPIDVTRDEARLRLLSFQWPDHPERLDRMRHAIELARASPPTIDAADAAEWLTERLSEPVGRKTMTVIQHSVMWQYLPDRVRSGVADAIAAAGYAATNTRPVARVSFEPARRTDAGSGIAITVTAWPGGEQRVVGRGHAHGRWIDWSG